MSSVGNQVPLNVIPPTIISRTLPCVLCSNFVNFVAKKAVFLTTRDPPRRSRNQIPQEQEKAKRQRRTHSRTAASRQGKTFRAFRVKKSHNFNAPRTSDQKNLLNLLNLLKNNVFLSAWHDSSCSFVPFVVKMTEWFVSGVHVVT